MHIDVSLENLNFHCKEFNIYVGGMDEIFVKTYFLVCHVAIKQASIEEISFSGVTAVGQLRRY